MEKKNIFTVSDFVSETNPDPPWSLSFLVCFTKKTDYTKNLWLLDVQRLNQSIKKQEIYISIW